MKTLRQFLEEGLTLQHSTEHRPGIYTGQTESKRGGKKKRMEHEVFAHNTAEAHDIMKQRHRDEHRLHPSDFIHSGTVQYHGEKVREAPPPPKRPHRDSAEQKFRDEMQKRYDSSDYKGD